MLRIGNPVAVYFLWMARIVRDDPDRPDPGFAELYASLPDVTDPEPWLGWCRAARGPVLYLGVGAGRIAVPLAAAGIELVGVDVHPGMLQRLSARLPDMELVRAKVEDLDLGRTFELVIAPSSLLGEVDRLRTAARHSHGRVGFELMNPHWLAAGAGPTVRVHHLSRRWAEFEVHYGADYVQPVAGRLVWPEDIEGHLGRAGLALEVMHGSDPEADLASCPTYYALAAPAASKRFRSAQMPST